MRKLSEPTPRRPEAEKTISLPSRSSSTAARTPARMIWPLKAPASPRSLVTSSIPTFETCSCSLRIGTLGRFSAASAAWRVIRRIADAYGRNAMIRCSARRSRAAEIISIARVIFWTFLTDATRFLSSLSAIC